MRIIFIPINSKSIKLLVLTIFLTVFALILLLINTKIIPASVSKDQFIQDLKQMFILRDKAVLEGNSEKIKNMFDTSCKTGLWAYEQEKQKINYLKNWAIIRNAKFTTIESDIKIYQIKDKGSSIWIDFLNVGKFTYVYNDKPEHSTSFGVGTKRTMELILKDGKWIIKREWYLNPFEDTIELPDEIKKDVLLKLSDTPTIIPDNFIFSQIDIQPVTNWVKRYNRDKAVAYAHKYCGANFENSNDYKYNKKYRNFTYLGGDCANFASQMLVEGGLRMDRTWFYSFTYRGIGGGTRAWLKASSLKQYLLYSGKAKLIMRGTLQQVSKPSAKYPQGAYKQLKKGDLVIYEKKDGSCHVSIITDFDIKGLPLVDSHSTDRYKVPWDMGWTNKSIKYWLLQIKD